MSSANPSQSTMSNQGGWVRPQPSSGGTIFSKRRANAWSRENLGKAAIMFFAIIGLGLSGYLAWVSLTSSKLAGCGAGQVFDCGHVMSTKWSAVFGVPVSIPAVFLYLTLAASIAVSWKARSLSVRSLANRFIAVAGITAALAAVWFISLQLFVVDHLCAYCLGAHACSLAIAGLLIWSQPIVRPQIWFASLIGLTAVGTLAALQVASPAPKTYEIQTFDVTTTNAVMSESSGEIFQAQPTGEKVFEAPVFEPPVFEAPNSESPISNDSDKCQGLQEIEAPKTSAAIDDSQSSTNRQRPFLTALLLNSNLFTVGMLAPVQETQQQDTDAKKDTDKKPAERRLVNLNGGQIKLDVAQWPICGKQSAKSIGIEMFDYTCPHCRKTHHALKAAMQRSNHEFAVVSLAVPMNSQCNPAVQSTNAHHITACDLAKLSVAVWRLDATKFNEYHDWLFTGEHAPSVASAKSKAETLVGVERLQKELASGVPQQYIAKHCQLYQSVGKGVIPKIYIGNSLLSGEIQSADTLLQLINRR